MADITYSPKTYKKDGGNTIVVASGGKLQYEGQGAVTQATSKATGVTLSNISGDITMNAASLAAATIVSFVLTNTLIEATDVIAVQHQSGGTLGAYTVNARAAAGSATIDLRNNTAAALAEAVVVRFLVHKVNV